MPEIIPILGHVACPLPGVTEPWQVPAETMRVRVDVESQLVRIEGDRSVHRVDVYLVCEASAGALRSEGERVQLLPEPEHGITMALVALALLARRRR